MTKAELKKFITDRVYPNNAQEITGEGLQESLLAILGEIIETPVSYAEQKLTPLERRVARNNINAGDVLYDVVFLVQGVPLGVEAFHLPSAVNISLSNRFKSFDTPVFFYVQGLQSLVPLFRTSDNLTRSGAYITSQGIVVITVKFEVDEENDIISVVSSEQQIIPISSVNGTAVSLGTGEASGNFSFSQGTGRALGTHAVSLGTGEASGNFSFSQGTGRALGTHAVSLGTGEASGDYAVSIGRNNTSSGVYAVSIGRNNTSSGAYAVSIGQNCKANNSYGFAFGQTITTNNQCEIGFGKYNISVESGDSAEATAFSIGDGSSNNPHNLFEIKKNGDFYINGKKVIFTFEE